MARLLEMYRTPKDAAAFDKYFFETHVPLEQKLPGLRKFEVSQGVIGSPAGYSGVHRIATLHFDSMAGIQAALASPQGKAAIADLENFAAGEGAVQMLIFEPRQV